MGDRAIRATFPSFHGACRELAAEPWVPQGGGVSGESPDVNPSSATHCSSPSRSPATVCVTRGGQFWAQWGLWEGLVLQEPTSLSSGLPGVPAHLEATPARFLTIGHSSTVPLLAWPLPGLSILGRNMRMVTEQAARHPSVGSGPIPWLLLCWRGPSCPPYLKELVVGEQAEEVLMSVADCSQEGREEASLYGALPVCPHPTAPFAPCSTNRVDS